MEMSTYFTLSYMLLKGIAWTLLLSFLLSRYVGCFLIGLTGNIACGKSSVLMHLSKEFPCYDWDDVTHDIQNPGGEGWANIIKAWMDENPRHPSKVLLAKDCPFLNSDWTFNRRYLRDKVFNDPQQKRRISELSKLPMIWAAVIRTFSGFLEQRGVVMCAPLLFESGLSYLCDFTITIACDEQAQLERCCQRDQISPDLATKIIRSQMSASQKAALSNTTLANNGSFQDLEIACEDLCSDLNQWLSSSSFSRVSILLSVLFVSTIFVSGLLLDAAITMTSYSAWQFQS